MADRFVDSDLAVRLTPDPEAGRRRSAEWSTAAHRGLEDRTLALMDTLASRSGPVISEAAVEAALGAAPGLGEDQVAAVRVLAGEGGSLRAVLSPAGYGKTTMLHTAAQAAGADGRLVVAVATTAKAVAELAGAGLDAKTIARLRIDLTDGPLAAGTVMVLDEISQTPTAEVEAVLAAVDACPGGSIWVLGDPRQSQPVGAGGAADRIEQLAADGLIPSARLTVNRRQVDAADREALDLLRRGDPGRIPAAAGRAGVGARARQPDPNPPGHGARRSVPTSTVTAPSRWRRSSCLTRRRGSRRPHPSPPGRHRRSDRADHGRPRLDRRSRVSGGGPGAAARPLRPVGQPAGQRHYRNGHPGRRRWAHRSPRQAAVGRRCFRPPS